MPCISPLLALNMTSASSFQMLRGAVIIFTGLFSVAFLGRRLVLSQWLGILATIAGLVVVGLADLLSKHDGQHKLSEVITGVARVGDPGAALPVLSCPLWEPSTESFNKFLQALLRAKPRVGACGDWLLWTCACSQVDR